MGGRVVRKTGSGGAALTAIRAAVNPGCLQSMEKGIPMGNNQQTLDEKRKQQLEALFADEPFLSPTMKARRLHEKLRELQAAETASAPGATGSSLPSEQRYW